MKPNRSVHVIISGRVQGVCYRLETQRAAVARNLKGWVRNLPDGTVEALFEGEAPAVADMLSWCHRGPRMARVDSVAAEERPCTGGEGGFEITY